MIKFIVGVGIAAALAGSAGVAAIAYNSITTSSESIAVSQSQQDKLDSYVEQL